MTRLETLMIPVYTRMLAAGTVTMSELQERLAAKPDLLAAVAAAWDDKQETETTN
jgi:hypothetical protein